MTLYLIGLGLAIGDITLRGMDMLRRCELIYLDVYTSVVFGLDLRTLSTEISKPIIPLDRPYVESSFLVDLAEGGEVALLVPGDPLTATTHHALVQECRDRGIEVKVAHAPSIATVVPAVLGLQWYKFGRSTTIPFPRPNYRPESPYMVIRDNLKEGLHTLVLLDIEPPKLMTANEGMEYLMEIEKLKQEQVMKDDRLVCVVARAGSESQFVVADRISSLLSVDFGPPPHSLVFPGPLHYMEEHALLKIRSKQKR